MVDDASTDNTCNVVESIIDSRVKLLRSEANGGRGQHEILALMLRKAHGLLCWILMILCLKID